MTKEGFIECPCGNWTKFGETCPEYDISWQKEDEELEGDLQKKKNNPNEPGRNQLAEKEMIKREKRRERQRLRRRRRQSERSIAVQHPLHKLVSPPLLEELD